MNLIYVYIIKSKNGLIRNQGFNFSKEFDIQYKDGEINIIDRANCSDYVNAVYNISALIGENGSGKSTIIQSIRDSGVDDENVCFIFKKDKTFYSNQKINISYNGSTSETELLTEKVIMIYTASNLITLDAFDQTINGVCEFKSEEGSVLKSPFKYVYDCSNLGIEKFLDSLNTNYSHNINDFIYYLVLMFIANNPEYQEKFLGSDAINYIFFDRTTQHQVGNLVVPKDKSSQTDDFYDLYNIFENAYVKFKTYLHMKDAKLSIKYSIILFYLDAQLNAIRKHIKSGMYSSSQLLIDKTPPEINYQDSLSCIISKCRNYICDITNELNWLKADNAFLDKIDNLIQRLNIKKTDDGNEVILFNEVAQNLISELLIGGYINLFVLKPVNQNADEIFLSAGEISLLSLFAKIEYMLNPFQVEKELTLNNEPLMKNSKTIILLLDEPDTYLHPNWSRNLIQYLTEYLNVKFGEEYDVQIILSSNNPFMLSDIYCSNVIKLEKNKLNKQIHVSNPSRQTFASNIHELLNDSFFMENTVGEYSYSHIKFIIELVSPVKRKKQEEKYKTQRQIQQSLNKRFNIKLKQENTYNYLRNMIVCIGEDVLRDKLLYMLDTCFGSQLSELAELRLQRERLDQQISMIESKGMHYD